MRIRRVINLYLNEPSHVELCEHLNTIEGTNRQQQALLQMALVGFRVMVKHESGQESLLRNRNPDISRLAGTHSRALLEGGFVLPKADGSRVTIEHTPVKTTSKKPRRGSLASDNEIKADENETLRPDDEKLSGAEVIHSKEPTRDIQEPLVTEEDTMDPLAKLQLLTNL